MTQPTCTTISRHVHDPVDTLTLDETARHRRRIAMTSDNGISFLLDLPEARLLRHGDGLVLDDGRVILVQAEPEALYDVRGRDPRHLLALAWQIGNRHLAAQIEADRILIRRDHVIREMLEGLGASVAEIDAAFDSEGGAYGGAHHAHEHGHDGHQHEEHAREGHVHEKRVHHHHDHAADDAGHGHAPHHHDHP